MDLNDAELRRLGIEPEYTDTSGRSRRSPDPALAAVAARLGASRREVAGTTAIAFVTVGADRAVDGARLEHHRGSTLILEDGTDLGPLTGPLPADLPMGYHRLHPDHGGHPTQLVATPGRCHLPDGLRAWGWAVQLYSARSRQSWGIGDLGDATTLARWLTETGHRVRSPATAMLLVNPLHAVNAGPEPDVSPYFAGSRCFTNPIYLRVPDVAGAASSDEILDELQHLAAEGSALNATSRIDRAAAWRIKSHALERLWSQVEPSQHQRVDQALAQDLVLAAHSAFNARCERFGDDWTAWPEALRRPPRTDPGGQGAPGGGRRSGPDGQLTERARFHAWLQLLMADQLDAVGKEASLLLDLAIGAGPGGFDTWCWQDLFVLDGTRIGAPPDEFNTQGQDWGLPPMDPWRLRTARYEPFVRMLRTSMAHCAGLRVDHVLGLFRQFWVPDGCDPGDGVYVRQPTDELLDLVALESVRAGALVVGEDLGTVGPGVRDELARRRLLSYRVMSLEDTSPSRFPAAALASFTTHDLPTLPGLWTGDDLAAQTRLDLHPNVESTEHARQRLADQTDLPPDAAVDRVVTAAYEALAAAPSAIVLGQLEDTAGVADRPNMPGTTDQWPNWVQPLPEPLDELLDRPLTVEVAETLARRGGPSPRPDDPPASRTADSRLTGPRDP